MKICVVIPCRNEAPFIGATIDAIFKSELPEHTELKVVVVDGMSNDHTVAVIHEKQLVYTNLCLVENIKKLTPFAFNLGIHAVADADFYQIVGARHVLSADYMKKCVGLLSSDSSIWCVGGKINNVFINETGRIISRAMGSSFGMGIGNFRTLNQSGFTDTVTSPMYPKWVFEKIGYFDEALIRNQDDDFNFRVTNAGGKIYYCNEIQLDYVVRSSKSNLWKQFMQYGYWKVFVNKKHHAITTFRQLVPPAFVLYLCLLPVVFFVFPMLGLFGSSGLLIYCMLAIVVSLKLAQSLQQFFQLITIFPILHFSYGWGYLKGILRFLILNKSPKESAKTLSR